MCVYICIYIHMYKNERMDLLPKNKVFKYFFGKEDLQGIFILPFLLMRNN